MTNTLIGYARCSTDKQDLAAQQSALVSLGVADNRIYMDRGLTGTNRLRPGLDQALAAVRRGDTLVVPKLDRLARSVPDARDIADGLIARGVRLALGSSVYGRWCTRQIQGEMAPNPKLLHDDRLATDGIRAPGRQHPVQHRHADGSLIPVAVSLDRSLPASLVQPLGQNSRGKRVNFYGNGYQSAGPRSRGLADAVRSAPL